MSNVYELSEEQILAIDEEFVVLDVRSSEKYLEGHVPHAIHIPLIDLESKIDKLTKDKMVLVYCVVGVHSQSATEYLRTQGFDAHNIGGYSEFTTRLLDKLALKK